MILASWALVYLLGSVGSHTGHPGSHAVGFWQSLVSAHPANAGFVAVLAMWLAMSAAMMLPTFVPSLIVYEDLALAGASKGFDFAALVAGYLLVWMGFSVVAASLQLLMSGTAPQLADRWISAAILLALAGAYQFSPLKEACLARCRSPLPYFIANWREGYGNTFSMGVRLGLVCVGCCWALMALALIGGAMNVAWMGLAMVIMIAEKLPEYGRFVKRPLGISLLVGSAITVVAHAA